MRSDWGENRRTNGCTSRPGPADLRALMLLVLWMTPKYPDCFSLHCVSTFQAVRRFLKLECKCHGVSGSCTLRTCWRALSDFRRTGDYLRRRYDGAVQVTATQDGANFTAARQGYRRATRTDLVYFDNSPDYCVLDKAAGE